ncbi:hypothetical protein [Legionella jordanis]|uniref:Uncharacterized protein n=1 Tax=Legionella jordanis TaxID=456 RepID=A0A0W0V9S8_9GAMM|nr:hypothetical protein [Legionella jordanis]KTD16377.1 hypothetical protein Ljor_0683 [Legionella jordanis]VEH12163.1 Uncharacterised protein [Legionella jordanis]
MKKSVNFPANNKKWKNAVNKEDLKHISGGRLSDPLKPPVITETPPDINPRKI